MPFVVGTRVLYGHPLSIALQGIKGVRVATVTKVGAARVKVMFSDGTESWVEPRHLRERAAQ